VLGPLAGCSTKSAAPDAGPGVVPDASVSPDPSLSLDLAEPEAGGAGPVTLIIQESAQPNTAGFVGLVGAGSIGTI
jgi:hypothetical protein